jgi:hypothetical protein
MIDCAGLEIEVKRLYIPIPYATCKCGNKVGFDDYVSYPVVGEPMEIYFYCGEYGAEWKEPYRVNMSVEKVEL